MGSGKREKYLFVTVCDGGWRGGARSGMMRVGAAGELGSGVIASAWITRQ